MRLQQTGRSILVGGALTLALSATPAHASQSGNRVDPRQYETVRALGHYVDIGAQYTLNEAQDFANNRDPRQSALIASLQDFAQRTDAFHERLDNYEASPFDFGSEAEQLRRLAQRVNRDLRGGDVGREVYDDWTAVIDGLDRLTRVSRGQSVDVPRAPAAWESAAGDDHQGHDRYRYGDGRHGAPDQYGSGEYATPGHPDHRRGHAGIAGDYRRTRLSASEVQQFQALAHELDVHVTRAHELAEREGTDDRARIDMIEELHRLNDRTAALHDRTDTGALDPNEFGPIVDQLATDARAVNDRMRQSGLFPAESGEWQQATRVLQRMAALMR